MPGHVSPTADRLARTEALGADDDSPVVIEQATLIATKGAIGPGLDSPFSP